MPFSFRHEPNKMQLSSVIITSPAAISSGAYLFPHSLHFRDRSWGWCSCFLLWLLSKTYPLSSLKSCSFEMYTSWLYNLLPSLLSFSSLTQGRLRYLVLRFPAYIKFCRQSTLVSSRHWRMTHHNTMYVHQDRLDYQWAPNLTVT